MPEVLERSSSVFDHYSRRKKPDVQRKKINQSGILIGIFLTITTIVLQCIAYSTPHWKEISPNTHSLYVDSIDALIRTETLVYFNSVHRFTHHSYGLFQRCESLLPNSSKLISEQNNAFHIAFNYPIKKCTKNFLPSFADEKFNECHSLQYYRFCSKTSERIFNINNDYLRATFNILPNPNRNTNLKSSCDCHYPNYIIACQILGIFALIFLILTALFFTIFLFLHTRYQRLKIKCFGVLSSLFAILFILINLSVVSNYLEYESIEYLAAIERHYRLSQIYKLSQDVKNAINRFSSSINIKLGYSAKIAWIAFALSIIDAILFMITCKVIDDDDEKDIGSVFHPAPSYSSQEDDRDNNDAYQTSTIPLQSTQNTTISQLPSSSHQRASSPLISTIVNNKSNKQSLLTHTHIPPSCLKRSHSPRIHFEDEV
jgi:hypothetical protein